MRSPHAALGAKVLVMLPDGSKEECVVVRAMRTEEDVLVYVVFRKSTEELEYVTPHYITERLS